MTDKEYAARREKIDKVVADIKARHGIDIKRHIHGCIGNIIRIEDKLRDEIVSELERAQFTEPIFAEPDWIYKLNWEEFPERLMGKIRDVSEEMEELTFRLNEYVNIFTTELFPEPEEEEME